MADIAKTARARKVFEDICRMLEKREYKFKTDDERMAIIFSVTGEDIPMDFIFHIIPESQIVRVTSLLPFTVPEEKRVDLAIAACHATSSIIDGSFDFDIENGDMYFRLTASFTETDIGEGLLKYLISYSCFAVDLFNDKLLAVAKGIMSVEDFMAKE